jgi:hypothetical protein
MLFDRLLNGRLRCPAEGCGVEFHRDELGPKSKVNGWAVAACPRCHIESKVPRR